MAMLANDWAQALDSEFQKPYYKNLYMFVKEEYSKQVVYPPADDIFNAFHFTPLGKVKVLLLGQDPYHNEHFGTAGPEGDTAVPAEYLSGAAGRSGLLHTRQRVSAEVGGSGRASPEHGAHRAGASGKFPSGKGLGGVHGRGDPGGTNRTDRLCICSGDALRRARFRCSRIRNI